MLTTWRWRIKFQTTNPLTFRLKEKPKCLSPHSRNRHDNIQGTKIKCLKNNSPKKRKNVQPLEINCMYFTETGFKKSSNVHITVRLKRPQKNKLQGLLKRSEKSRTLVCTSYVLRLRLLLCPYAREKEGSHVRLDACNVTESTLQKGEEEEGKGGERSGVIQRGQRERGRLRFHNARLQTCEAFF